MPFSIEHNYEDEVLASSKTDIALQSIIPEDAFLPTCSLKNMKDWLLEHPEQLRLLNFTRRFYTYQKLIESEQAMDLKWQVINQKLACELLQTPLENKYLLRQFSQFPGELAIPIALSLLADYSGSVLPVHHFHLHQDVSGLILHLLLYSQRTQPFNEHDFVQTLQTFPKQSLLMGVFFNPEFSPYFEQALEVPEFSAWIKRIHRINHYQVSSPQNRLNFFVTAPFQLRHRQDFPDGYITSELVRLTKAIPPDLWDEIQQIWRLYKGPRDILYFVQAIREASLEQLRNRLAKHVYGIKLSGIQYNPDQIQELYFKLNQIHDSSDSETQTAVQVAIHNLAISHGYPNRELMELDFFQQIKKKTSTSFLPAFISYRNQGENQIQELFSRFMRLQTPLPKDVVFSWKQIPPLRKAASQLFFVDDKRRWGVLNWQTLLLESPGVQAEPSDILFIIHPLFLHIFGLLDKAKSWLREKSLFQPISQIMRPFYPIEHYDPDVVFKDRYRGIRLNREIWQHYMEKKGWLFPMEQYPSKPCFYHPSTKVEIELVEQYKSFAHLESFQIDRVVIQDMYETELAPSFLKPVSQQFYSEILKELDWAFVLSADIEALWEEQHPIVVDLVNYRLNFIQRWFTKTSFEFELPCIIFVDKSREYQLNLLTGVLDIHPQNRKLSEKNYPPVSHVSIDKAMNRLLGLIQQII